eukprot:1719967-Amphidinium_carterae.1
MTFCRSSWLPRRDLLHAHSASTARSALPQIGLAVERFLASCAIAAAVPLARRKVKSSRPFACSQAG